MKDRPHHLRLVVGSAPASQTPPAKVHQPPDKSADQRRTYAALEQIGGFPALSRKLILLGMMRPAALEVIENLVEDMLAEAGGAA